MLASRIKMPDYTLYGFYHSSSTARVRIALELKNIPFDYVPVNLSKNEHLTDEHRRLNPSATVPLLVRHTNNGADASDTLRIGQSVAALEYLEEAHKHQGPSLLPLDINARAVVRALVNIITSDTAPVMNLRMRRRVQQLGGDLQTWTHELMAAGLGAYEAVSAAHTGTYSVGDEVTMADMCLVPMVWKAREYKVDLTRFQTILMVMDNMEKLPAVKRSSYYAQIDTPENLKA